jgi:hypothetical protein
MRAPCSLKALSLIFLLLAAAYGPTASAASSGFDIIITHRGDR